MRNLLERNGRLPGYGALVVEAHRRLWHFARANAPGVLTALMAWYVGLFALTFVLVTVGFAPVDPPIHGSTEDGLIFAVASTAFTAFVIGWFAWFASSAVLFWRDGDRFTPLSFAAFRAAEARWLAQRALLLMIAALWALDGLFIALLGSDAPRFFLYGIVFGIMAGFAGLAHGIFRLGAGPKARPLAAGYGVINRLAACALPGFILFLMLDRVGAVITLVAGATPSMPVMAGVLLLIALKLAAIAVGILATLAGAFRLGRAAAAEEE